MFLKLVRAIPFLSAHQLQDLSGPRISAPSKPTSLLPDCFYVKTPVSNLEQATSVPFVLNSSVCQVCECVAQGN